MLKKIDSWINCLEGNTIKISPEESIKKIVATIVASYSDDKKKTQLLVSGGAPLSEIIQTSEKLGKFLPSHISCKTSANIAANAKTVELAMQCDGIILVEKLGSSTYPMIDQEIQTFKDLKKDIMGFILV